MEYSEDDGWAVTPVIVFYVRLVLADKSERDSVASLRRHTATH